jgi:hypothetical protein
MFLQEKNNVASKMQQYIRRIWILRQWVSLESLSQSRYNQLDWTELFSNLGNDFELGCCGALQCDFSIFSNYPWCLRSSIEEEMDR